MPKIKNFLTGLGSGIAVFFVILGLIILIAAISFALFSLGYWLITLILASFFAFTLPFSWGYSFGGWLIWLVITTFIAPGFWITRSND